jgi:hypothetical protein
MHQWDRLANAEGLVYRTTPVWIHCNDTDAFCLGLTLNILY